MTKKKCKELWENYRFEIVLGIALLVQLLFLCWFNLFHTEDVNDYDASGAYVHIMEMVQSHSLLPEHYLESTTLDIDSMAGVTAVLYALIGNIFVAQGICNVLLMVVYLLIIREICNQLQFKNRTFFVLGLMFFLPYYDNHVGVNMTGYAAMQFLNVAPNSVRNLIPLLYLSALLDFNRGIRGGKYKLKAIVSIALMVLTSVSAGYYVFAFGILSLVIGDFVWVELSGDAHNLRKTAWYLHLSMTIACVIGLCLQHAIGFVPKMERTMKITAVDMPMNTARWFVGIFELFGGVIDTGTPLLSVGGITEVCNFFIACFYIITVIYYVRKWLHDRELPRYMYYILCMCIVDAIAMNLLNLTYGSSSYEARYHIMPMLMVMILSASVVDKLWDYNNVLLRRSISVVGILVLVCVTGLSDRRLYADMRLHSAVPEMHEMAQALEELQVETAIIYTEQYEEIIKARKFRAYGKQFDVLMPNPKCDPQWGGTDRAFDNTDQGNVVALLTTEEEFHKLPEYYHAGATLIGTYGSFQMYLLERSAFDVAVGLPQYDDDAIDYPYTEEYTISNGELYDDGSMIATGADDIALCSPTYVGVDGTWKYTLKYEVLSAATVRDGAYLSIKNAGAELCRVDLDAESTEASVIASATSSMTEMTNCVYVPEGMKIRIYSIKMERSK